jgi:hypothetical protein
VPEKNESNLPLMIGKSGPEHKLGTAGGNSGSQLSMGGPANKNNDESNF